MQSVSQKSSNDVQVQKKASIELDLLRSFGEKVYEEQRRVMLSPDMQFKLNTHMPTVLAVTESVYPNDETKQVAAFLHDIGRGDEFALTGGFVGKESWTIMRSERKCLRIFGFLRTKILILLFSKPFITQFVFMVWLT